MKEKEKGSKDPNRWSARASRAFRGIKGSRTQDASNDDKIPKDYPKQQQKQQHNSKEDLPWGGVGPSSPSAAAPTDIDTNTAASPLALTLTDNVTSPTATIIADNGHNIEVSPVPSINLAKDAKGKEIVDKYLKYTTRDLNAIVKEPKRNQKKLDEYGFIVNLDDTGELRDEGSVNIPGGAYTPSADAPRRIHNGKNRRKNKSKLSKRERRQLAKLHRRREKKWIGMLNNWDGMLVTQPKMNKLCQRIRKGVPNSVRGQAWTRMAKVQQKVNDTHAGVYAKLVALSCERKDDLGLETFQPDQEGSVDNAVMKEIIERDLTRTFPRHTMFYDQDDSDDSDEEYSDGSFDRVSQSGSFDSLSQTSTGEEEETDRMIGSDSNRRASDTDLCDASQTLQDCANECLSKVPKMFTEKKEEIFVTVKTPTQRRKKVKAVVDFSSAEGGQAKLRRVLRAYSIYDLDVGYCQGMNFIAAMFITFVEEEEAFWILVYIMNESPCRMRGLFGEGMTEAHQVLHVADRLINQFNPRLARHFDKEQIHISMFATQWLLTMYTSSFPFDVVTRVWDAFLSEGWKVAYRVMLALLEMAQPLLMKMNFEEILNYFKEMPFEIDANEIMELSFKIPLKKKHITKYAKEYDRRKV